VSLVRPAALDPCVAARYVACNGARVIQSIERSAIVETLLNTLEAERYVRGPLLATIADELSASGEGLAVAAGAARSLLERWQAGQLGESEFIARIRALRPLVQARQAALPSGERASAA
jgi:hypothetical protein